MKKCYIILTSIISMYALTTNAQTPFSQCIRTDVDLGYTLAESGTEFANQVNAFGFGLGADYCIGGEQLKFVASPFIFLWQGNDLATMKPYYKSKGNTLTMYNGGTYYNSGVLFGLHYTFERAVPDKLPVFTTNLQYGFFAANLPEVLTAYNTADLQGVSQRFDAAKGFGAALKLGVGMDLVKANNTLYHIGVSYKREAADIPQTEFSKGALSQTEIFKWRTNTIMLNLGATFELN